MTTSELLDALAGLFVALLPRRVVAHAFARVLSDVRWYEGFDDPGGFRITRVVVIGHDKWGAFRNTYDSLKSSTASITATTRGEG